MILQYIFLVKIIGSNLVVCAREGGANTTLFQAAHFALQNTKNKTGEKKASNRAKPEKQKGKKEGGLGEGIFALLRLRIERFRFSLIKRNTKQKNFLFLLKEKIAREKIKKCRENFSVLVCRSGAEASGNAPHSCSGFSLKKKTKLFSAVCSFRAGRRGFASARARRNPPPHPPTPRPRFGRRRNLCQRSWRAVNFFIHFFIY